jgi:hypothetical protein
LTFWNAKGVGGWGRRAADPPGDLVSSTPGVAELAGDLAGGEADPVLSVAAVARNT